MAKRKGARTRKRTSAHATSKPHRATGIDGDFEKFIGEMARHGRRMHGHAEKSRDFWHSTFGVAGPLLASALGVVGVAIVAWVLSLVNLAAQTAFLAMLSAFLNANLPVFLMIFLITNYLKHVYFSHSRLYYILKPAKVAFETGVALWLLAWAMEFAGLQLDNAWLYMTGAGIIPSLPGIFVVLFVAGLLFMAARHGRKACIC